MPRPLRIEFKNAFYHVINRGRGRQTIYHDPDCYNAFIATMEEAYQRFGCLFHAYTLMGNHYHLLLETPEANLSRVMQHIGGKYTQRYNRLMKTDGPLFRGRFKAILVSQNQYLVNLSRYIHRNPIETKSPIVTNLEDYPWSSYPVFIGRAQAPEWLEQTLTYKLLNHQYPYEGYRDFVMQGSDEETVKFHKQGKVGNVFGDDVFKYWVFDELLPELEAQSKCLAINARLPIQIVVSKVAEFYGVPVKELTAVTRGPQGENEARKVAMYLCQEISSARLCAIAELFNLNHCCSVGHSTFKIRARKREDELFAMKIDKLTKSMLK